MIQEGNPLCHPEFKNGASQTALWVERGGRRSRVERGGGGTGEGGRGREDVAGREEREKMKGRGGGTERKVC